MRRFLLIGGYACNNPGDEAILKSTVYFLNELYPESLFYIWADRENFSVTFDREIFYRVIHWQPFRLMLSDGFLAKVLTKVYTDLFPFSRRLVRLFTRRDRKFMNALRKSDKVIFIGGGYLNSYYSLINMNYLALLAEELCKPVVLLGQTLGPFHRPQHRTMAGEIFRIAEKIVLRESYSEKEVSEFPEKVLCGADDAIAFEPRLTQRDREMVDRVLAPGQDREVYNVGINLVRRRNSRAYYERIAEALRSFCQTVPEARVHLFFIPMETSRYCDDRLEGERFARYVPPECEYRIIREDWPVEVKFHFISRLDLLIGMRLHSLVFSLTGGVPAIGIYQDEYYLRKVCGLLKSFGLDGHALLMDKTARLPELIGEALRKREHLRSLILRNKSDILTHQRSLIESVMRGIPDEN